MARPAFALAVQGVQLTPQAKQTKIAVALSEPAPYSAFIVPDPWRLVIDLPAFDWQTGKISRPDGNIVTGVRQGSLKPGTSRIVFDLRAPAIIKSARFDDSDLVIQLASASAVRAMAAKAKIFTSAPPPVDKDNAQSVAADVAGETLAPPAGDADEKDADEKDADKKDADKPVKKSRLPAVQAVVLPPDTKPPAPAGKPLIIIDAGHGGIDPGTHGPGDIVEKNVTLAVARTLRDTLVATGRYRVLLTRDSDTYLYLPQRVAFARAHHGDMFVSLHADSSPLGGGARGASVYTLSENASDAETAKLAAKENRADQVAGVNLSGQDDDVAGILVDLAMRNTMNQSNFLASTVVDNLHGNNIPLLAEKPHRSAGFAVLKDPDVPSILVEMGFLSNPQQAQALVDPDFQHQLAAALTASIDAYFARIRDSGRP